MPSDLIMPVEILLPVLFFAIAAAYSSVGFGGGSSYLAILSIFFTNFYEIRSTALLLNLTVVTIGTIMYMRHRVFNLKQFWPFLITSIPLAYFGATLKLSERTFFLFLGCLLILSGIALIFKFLQVTQQPRKLGLFKGLGLGAGIGFFSGLTGIGGGIYLSPILNFIKWGGAKKIAALASIFIWVNSAAGLSGLIAGGSFQVDRDLIWKLILGVLLGGLVGSYLSNQRLNTKVIGLLTALLVIYVGLRLLLFHIFGWRI